MAKNLSDDGKKKWNHFILRTESMQELLLHLQKHGKGTKYDRHWEKGGLDACQQEIVDPTTQTLADEEVGQVIEQLKIDHQYQEELEQLRMEWMKCFPYVLPPVGTVQYAQMYGLWKFNNEKYENHV